MAISQTMDRLFDMSVEREADLRAAYERIRELEYLLADLDEYFDNRADADCDQEGFIPNEEMKFLTRIRELCTPPQPSPAPAERE